MKTELWTFAIVCGFGSVDFVIRTLMTDKIRTQDGVYYAVIYAFIPQSKKRSMRRTAISKIKSRSREYLLSGYLRTKTEAACFQL